MVNIPLFISSCGLPYLGPYETMELDTQKKIKLYKHHPFPINLVLTIVTCVLIMGLLLVLEMFFVLQRPLCC